MVGEEAEGFAVFFEGMGKTYACKSRAYDDKVVHFQVSGVRFQGLG